MTIEELHLNIDFVEWFKENNFNIDDFSLRAINLLHLAYISGYDKGLDQGLKLAHDYDL